MKHFFCALCLLLLTGAALQAAPAAGARYAIRGKLQGMDTGWVYISYHYQETDHIDSTRIAAGNFFISAHLPEPLMVTMKLSGNPQQVSFLAGYDTITVQAAASRLFDAAVSGSPEQDAWMKYREEFMAKVPRRNGRDDTAFVKALENQSEAYVRQYSNWLGAAIVIYDRFISYKGTEKAKVLYEVLDPAVKQSYYGRRIAYYFDAGIRTALGAVAPVFRLPDAAGVMRALQEFRGKYLLVDFWASWCPPCRKENPELVKAYLKYKTKGFDILGVSLDSNKPQWLAAVAKDGLLWTQLCDSNGYDGGVTALYGIKAVPQNFLLDKNGKIIAKNLRGEQLQLTLQAILGQ
ncbi:TlpA disulfide reductase family protein [Filimonas effusa]|nr:TlpA disulfide reductase family protein [Filimonas effusa]